MQTEEKQLPAWGQLVCNNRFFLEISELLRPSGNWKNIGVKMNRFQFYKNFLKHSVYIRSNEYLSKTSLTSIARQFSVSATTMSRAPAPVIPLRTAPEYALITGGQNADLFE